jgi:nitroimidazol reductase NimA-like FMN-containing flavoprotein (pyridoxamine 5'-phosphate oxidase superfamily)
VSEKNQADERTRLRRNDKAADDAWICALLRRAPFGSLATLADGQPFINMNLFVFDEPNRVLYMHTARQGRTRSNVEGDERVAFSVGEMGRLLPAKEALEMSVEYNGVVVFGRAAIVSDEAEARHALCLLLDKYFPHLQRGRDYRDITRDELDRTAVYRIRIESWSGKRNQKEPGFPGAFDYRPPPPQAQEE